MWYSPNNKNHILYPEDPEGGLEVSSLNLERERERRWPVRSTRNVLLKRHRKNSNQYGEYPMTNYTRTLILQKWVKQFVKELSKVQISNNVEEAVKLPKWIETMETKMKALETA
jgi:ribosomal protein S10